MIENEDAILAEAVAEADALTVDELRAAIPAVVLSWWQMILDPYIRRYTRRIEERLVELKLLPPPAEHHE